MEKQVSAPRSETSSAFFLSSHEADGQGANHFFLTHWKENARRTPQEIGASASGMLLKDLSTPRHKDLNAGIWIRAVRRARKQRHSELAAAIANCS